MRYVKVSGPSHPNFGSIFMESWLLGGDSESPLPRECPPVLQSVYTPEKEGNRLPHSSSLQETQYQLLSFKFLKGNRLLPKSLGLPWYL